MEFVRSKDLIHRYAPHPGPPGSFKPRSYNPTGGEQFAPKLAPDMLGRPTKTMVPPQQRQTAKQWHKGGFATDPAPTLKGLDTKKAFELFDADGNGSLDVRELMSALAQLGIQVSSEQTMTIMSRYDDSNNGLLELPEFERLVAELESGALPVGKRGPSNPFASRLATGIDARALFASFDRDGNGTIDMHELKAALAHRGLHVSPAQAATIMTHYDADGNGCLDLGEFKRLATDLEKGVDLRNLSDPYYKFADPSHALFASFDRDGSGSIDMHELSAALTHRGIIVNAQQAGNIMNHYDSDSNGSLDLTEFKRLADDLERGVNLYNFAEPIAMRGGWPVGGQYSRGAGTWYKGTEAPANKKDVQKNSKADPIYNWRHRNFVNTSPLGADCP